MKLLRNLLFSVFGLQGYLRIVSRIYLFLVHNGLLKSKYPELFYLKKIVKKGDVCIDIGANLGYYSVFISKLCGKEGQLYSVEPVPMFRKVWNKNIKLSRIKNWKLLPFALGDKEQKIKMGMPEVDGVLHHGMTKVLEGEANNIVQHFEAEMRIPDKLFSDLEKLDFIKCDVEGFEHHVFTNLQDTLKKFKPLVQSELAGEENRMSVINLFKSFDYKACLLINGKLEEIAETEYLKANSDFYFIP